MYGMTLELQNISKSFDGLPVLRNLNLSFHQGQCYCLMSPSGSGKTTLLRILMGLEQPDQGMVLAGGKPQDMNSLTVSAVFQEDRLCENLSTEANIRLVQKGGKGRSRDFLQQLQDGFSAVGLEGWGKRPVKELSGGMKRRAALLRALYADWNILLLDEPFKGLDRETKDKVLAFVREKCRGKTVLCVTHEKEEAEILGAEILEL